MKLDQIKKRALQECPDLDTIYVNFYRSLNVTCHTATQTLWPIDGEAFVKWCDSKNYPAYHITGNLITIAPTYLELYQNEMWR